MVKDKTTVMDDAAHNAKNMSLYIHSGLGNTRQFHSTGATVVKSMLSVPHIWKLHVWICAVIRHSVCPSPGQELD